MLRNHSRLSGTCCRGQMYSTLNSGHASSEHDIVISMLLTSATQTDVQSWQERVHVVGENRILIQVS